jgi:hypothetical protein
MKLFISVLASGYTVAEKQEKFVRLRSDPDRKIVSHKTAKTGLYDMKKFLKHIR